MRTPNAIQIALAIGIPGCARFSRRRPNAMSSTPAARGVSAHSGWGGRAFDEKALCGARKGGTHRLHARVTRKTRDGQLSPGSDALSRAWLTEHEIDRAGQDPRRIGAPLRAHPEPALSLRAVRRLSPRQRLRDHLL